MELPSTAPSLAPAVPRAPEPGFLQALRVQWRIIRALMLREAVTRYGRENLGLLWVVAEPMIFTTGVAAMWSSSGLRHFSHVPVVAFAVTGYSSVLLWRSTVSRCNRAIPENFNLLYHRNVLVFDVFMARILLEVAGVTASFLFLVLLFTATGFVSLPHDPLKVIEGWLILAWFGMSLAILIGSATAHSEIVERIWHPVSYLMFPLSGAAFMMDWLPAAARPYIAVLPMIHGLELLREGYFGHLVKTHYDIPYVVTANLCLMFLGLLLLRSAARRVESPVA